MQTKEITFLAYKLGEQQLEIKGVGCAASTVNIYFADNLFQPFNLNYNWMIEQLQKACCSILKITQDRFANRFDGKNAKAVAKKLNKALVGKMATVDIIANSCIHTTNIDKEIKTIVSHKIKIIVNTA